MAHPADPAAKAAATFANGRLTPEEADRLAAMFRPSWEFDEAPFTGAGSLSPSEIQALQGGGVRADVRAVAAAAAPPPAPATNGTHAATPGHEPENSVVIDRSITAADLAQTGGQPGGAPKIVAKTIMGGLQAPMAPPAPEVAAPPTPPLTPAPKPVSQRPAAPDFRVGPPVARSPASVRQAIQIDEPVAYPRKSRKGLFIGVGVAAALLVGVGIYTTTSGGEKPVPAAATTAPEKPAEDKLAAVPPPPAVTTTTEPTTPAPPPPAQNTAAVAPTTAPAQPPSAPVTALPVAPAPPPPPPQPHYAAAPTPPRQAPAAPRPKRGGQTIVRDVPF